MHLLLLWRLKLYSLYFPSHPYHTLIEINKIIKVNVHDFCIYLRESNDNEWHRGMGGLKVHKINENTAFKFLKVKLK